MHTLTPFLWNELTFPDCKNLDQDWNNVETKPELPVKHGVSVTLNCVTGYVNKGGDKAKCLSGKFVSDAPSRCSLIGNSDFFCFFPDQNFEIIWSMIQMIFNGAQAELKNMILENNNKIIQCTFSECNTLSSAWTNVVTNPVLPVTHGRAITLACVTGYENKGGDKAKCHLGRLVLDSTPPKCSLMGDTSTFISIKTF